MLASVRAVLRTEKTGRAGRPRASWQMEEAEPNTMSLYRSLVDRRYESGPTPPSG